MSHLYKLVTASIFLLFGFNVTLAQNIGVIAKASTSGIGVDVAYRVKPKMLLRAGYDSFSYNYLTTIEADTNIGVDATLNAGTLGLFLDYNLLKKMYISAGIVLNNFETTIEGTLQSDYTWGDVVISASKLGKISWGIAPANKIAPYVGIGIGRLASGSKLINTSIELGAILQGVPEVSIISSGVFQANGNESFNQEAFLGDILKGLNLYPVLKINFGINLNRD